MTAGETMQPRMNRAQIRPFHFNDFLFLRSDCLLKDVTYVKLNSLINLFTLYELSIDKDLLLIIFYT